MRTAYCPKTHRELAKTSKGTEYGHVPGHQYHDVDVVISQSRDGKFRCHIVESWGSAQGYDEEHGRREATGRGESIRESAADARETALAAGVHQSYLAQAVSMAIDEATEIVVESNTESSSVTIELTDEDATELYYAFRNRGHSSTRVKVAEFLKASDKRNGRDSRDCDWYNGDLESN